MSSQKKIEGNRRNSHRSTGPKSPRGKANSCMNALREGVFSRQLIVKEEDRAAFEALGRNFRAQLNPTTAVRSLIADAIVTAAWRCSQAICRETRELTAEVRDHAGEVAPNSPPTLTEYYAAHPQAANRAQALLHAAAAEIQQARGIGSISAETLADLEKAFGNEFVQELTEWQSSDELALRMLTSWRMKAEQFNTPMPETASGTVLADPRQKIDMQLKLLRVKGEHLEDVRQLLKQADIGQRIAMQPEPAHRYVTAAFRLFLGLVAFYAKLRELRM